MDDDRFLKYISEYKDAFYRFLKRNLHNTAMIDDVFSDAVITAYQEKDKFQDGTNFKAWMYKILLNKCFCANRDVSFHWESLEDYSDELSTPYEVWKTNKNNANDDGHLKDVDIDSFLENCSDEVCKSFMNLSLLQRLCIFLKDVEDFSYKEIAHILDIPEASVMTYLARGRAKLRTLLTDKMKQKITLSYCIDNNLETIEKKI